MEDSSAASSDSAGAGRAKARADLVAASACLVRVGGGVGNAASGVAAYHDLMAAVHGFVSAAHAAETAGLAADEMKAIAAEAHTLCGKVSSILSHAQRWPRGYPGDFQMIERLIDGQPAGAEGSPEHLLDQMVLNLPIVEQHRGKIAWQAGCVREGLSRRDQLRVLSIACGGARDLMLLDGAQLGRLTLVVNDVDGEAVALASSRLAQRVRALSAVPGNVLRRLNRLRALGPYDLIVVGGLLDYLPQRPATALIAQLARMLAPEGRVAVTNIAAGNPWRLFLELLANWTLIHRDRDTMRALLSPERSACELVRDRSGLTWLGLVHAAA